MELLNELTQPHVEQNARSVPVVLDGKFFVIVSTEPNGTVKAKCLNCANGKKSKNAIVSGRFQPSSNFTTHLKRMHPSVFNEYVKYKDSSEPKLKRQRQPQLPFPVTRESSYKSKSERLIVKFIINTMSPLSLVEHPDFVALVKGLNPEAESLTRRTLTSKINLEYERVMRTTKSDLANAIWICITADIWSSRSRSFLGVTSHWLDSTLKRKSAILAISRFPGRHTSDKIIEKLNDIFQKFSIQDKVSFVVTDNGSNFVKALKEYGVNSYDDDPDVEIEELEMDNDFHLDSDEFLGNKLPVHIRCASHTLSLVATKDVEFTMDSGRKVSNGNAKGMYKKIMRCALSKCSALWNKASRSVQVSESIKALTGKVITRPVVTRWNSLFDAVQSLLNLKEKLNAVFELAEVEKLKSTEVVFLEEYVSAMRPLANALDTLQSENEFYYGFLAPCVFRVMRELNNQISMTTASGFGAQIASDLKVGLESRFGDILKLDLESAELEIVSAILMPCFKLKWVPKPSREKVKDLFVKAAVKFSANYEIETPVASEPTVKKSKWTDFFDDDGEVQTNSNHEMDCQNVELQCLTYLEDSRDTVDMLNENKYSLLKSMFTRFNTAIPSSAPAERLFSYGGMVLRPQRSRLTDEMFEKLVILKVNGTI